MDLSKNVNVIKLGYSYNKPLVFNKHLRSPTFGFDYNIKLAFLKHLVYLVLGYCYNVPIILNKYVRFISINVYNKHKCTLDFLPNKMAIETMECKNNKIIDELPNNVTTLLGTKPIAQFNNIPNGTNYVHVDVCVSKHILRIPYK